MENLLGYPRDMFVNDTLFWKKTLHTDDCERIFGLFNRFDPNINGTGIGLTLAKRIIEIHDGRIWV